VHNRHGGLVFALLFGLASLLASAFVWAQAGTLVFTSATFSVNEQQGPGHVTVTVDRVGGSTGVISTLFTTSDGTATAPADYQAQSFTVTFLNGAVGPATINIPVVADNVVEGNETFDVHLTGGAAGALNQATVTILESPGILEFTSPTYSIDENGVGFVVVQVTRTGGVDGTISTTFTTSDGTATAPADYQAQAFPLTFLNNATGPASISIPIVNDGVFEGSETFLVHLTGGQAGGLTLATVTIVDPFADLAVTKTGPGIANPGDNLSYALSVANNGNVNALSVALSDPLPPNTTFFSLIQNTGPAFICAAPTVGANGTVTCNIATLAAGASATFTLVVRVNPGLPATTTVTNTASATTTTFDPTPANNAASAVTFVSVAQITPTLSQWALLLLSVLMASAFLFAARLRRN
jgi:uncharacterized repeat protein (TIGR01451 family)